MEMLAPDIAPEPPSRAITCVLAVLVVLLLVIVIGQSMATGVIADRLGTAEARIAKAEADARTATSKVFREQEMHEEAVNAMNDQHSLALYELQNALKACQAR